MSYINKSIYHKNFTLENSIAIKYLMTNVKNKQFMWLVKLSQIKLLPTLHNISNI